MSDLAQLTRNWQDSASPLAITEFMASNTSILADQDGDFSDWIEVCNISDKPVDLKGWYLTDEQNTSKKWAFPNMSIDSGDYLLVFASEKNRSLPNDQLHANFSLNREGDYLAITKPDSNMSHEYPKPFPEQLPDISYGTVENSSSTYLLIEGDSLKHHVPANGNSGDTWYLNEFDDSQWSDGFSPVGYEQGGQLRQPTQLVGYWTFDDDVLDRSGNQNHGSLFGPDYSEDIPPTISTGKSLSFDGLTNYLKVTDSESLDFATGIGQPCTVAFWFKTYEEQNKIVMEKGNKQHFVTRMEAFADAGKISYRMQQDIENQVMSTQPVNDGTWHHFLSSYDGATIRLYIDGVLNDQANDTGSADNNDPLLIGSRLGAAAYGGMIDDLAIWNCALDENQILLLSDGTVSPLNVNQAAPVVDNRLAGYWNFDGTTEDATDQNNDSENKGAVLSTEVPPAIGQGMSAKFDGLNDYLMIPDSPDLRIASEFTLSLWIKSDDINQTHKYLLSRHGSGVQQAVIYEYVDNHVEFFGPNASGGDPRPDSQMPIPDTNWHHIAYTADGTTWSGYIDGIAIFSVERSFVLNTGEYPWYVGSANGGAGFFNGWIDDVSIWNKALNQNEVVILAAGTSPLSIAGYENIIRTDIESQMYEANPSVYIRQSFEVDDPGELESLSLCVKYDDGFAAFLNGVEVARRNAPVTSQWNSIASQSHPDAQAVLFEDIDISPFITVLEPGANLLAVQGLNQTADDDDFLWSCELTAKLPHQSQQTYRYFSKPTPAAPNGESAQDIGPIIAQATHTPDGPLAGENIVITASVTESFFPVNNVRIIYRVMYGPQISITMRDDGLGYDQVAGDNLYTAIIPAAAFAPGEMVRWCIKAVDIQQNQTRWPIFNDPTGSPEYLGTVVQDPAVSSNIPVFHWFVEPGTEQAARTRSGTRCSLFYDGELYDNIFVRLRGATAAGLAKNPYKFEFNKGYYFSYSDDFPEIDEFDLNTTYRDKAYVRPILGFELYRDAGVPYCEVLPVHVRRNKNFFSVAIFTEHPDKTYLQRNGLDPEGTIYKANLNGFTPGAQGGYLDVYSGFEKKNPKDNDMTDIVTFVNGLAQTGKAQTNFVFDNVDIPGIVNYMAASVLIQDADRLVTNFYTYRDTFGTGEWTMLPWDLDLAIGQAINSSDQMFADDDYPNGPSHPFYGAQNYSDWRNSHLWNKMIDVFSNTPVLREMFLRRLRSLMDSFLMPTGTPAVQLYFENRIDELFSLMANDVQLDKAKWSSWGQSQTFQQALDRIKNDYLAPRRQHLYINHRADDIQQSDPTILVSEDAVKTVIVPTSAVNESWKSNINFNDSSWISGTGGVGYEAGSGNYASYFDIDTKSLMYNINGTCLIRIPFTVEGNPASFEKLSLRIRYDDGFIAYINGTLVEQKNAPADPKWDSPATAGHTDNSAVVFIDHDISDYINTLNQGENLLAIHGLNGPASSSDFLISVELIEGDFETSNPAAVGIPAAQTDSPAIDFGAIDFNPDSANQDQEYIELVNNNNTAVDISGWHLTDGIDFKFKPGTIIPSGKSLFLSPDVTAFRIRPDDPSGGQGLFIQGNYKGHLSSWGETINLTDTNNNLINTISYSADPSNQQSNLRITEIMYYPPNPDPDSQYNDEDFEFIELKNIGDSSLELTDVKFTQGIIYIFAQGSSLPPNGYLLLVKNTDAFASRYTVPQGVEVLGPYMGSLANDGEKIKLDDPSNSTILEFSYNDWYSITDGVGFSLTIVDAESTSHEDWDQRSSWRSSTFKDGTPGLEDTGAAPDSIVINEILAHSHDIDPANPSPDWIELKNTTDSDIDISGWFMTDDDTDDLARRKFEFAPNTIIGANGYRVFYQENNRPETGDPADQFPFGLSEGGEKLYIYSGLNGQITGYYSTAQKFGSSASGVTMGRYEKISLSNGYDFTAMSTPTMGTANTPPSISPIVITEIMYNPADNNTGGEYVEIHNTSTTENIELMTWVQIQQSADPADVVSKQMPWILTDAIEFVFPNNTVIGPGQCLIVARQPDSFKIQYAHLNIPDENILGPFYDKKLGSSDNLKLAIPGDKEWLEDQFYIVIDRVEYDNEGPWPSTPDGTGPSLNRISNIQYANDPDNWQPLPPNPN